MTAAIAMMRQQRVWLRGFRPLLLPETTTGMEGIMTLVAVPDGKPLAVPLKLENTGGMKTVVVVVAS
jgi:hypothetical protein